MVTNFLQQQSSKDVSDGRDITQAEQQEAPMRVENLRNRFEESQLQHATASDGDHEPVDSQLQAARLDELFRRKAEILDRHIDSETAARGVIDEMQMVDVTLAHLNG